MKAEQIKKIASDYLNDCEEESAVLQVFDLALKVIEQKPCEDCISRQAVLDELDKSKYSKEFCEEHHIDWSINLDMAHIVVNKLKPVTSHSKTGHWIKMPLVEAGQTYSHKCSLCGRRILATDVGLSEFPYCHCGANMIEPQEEAISDANMKMREQIFEAESKE